VTRLDGSLGLVQQQSAWQGKQARDESDGSRAVVLSFNIVYRRKKDQRVCNDTKKKADSWCSLVLTRFADTGSLILTTSQSGPVIESFEHLLSSRIILSD